MPSDPGTEQEAWTFWLCFLQGRIRISAAQKQHLHLGFLSPSSLLSVSPSSLLGEREQKAIVSPHCFIGEGKREGDFLDLLLRDEVLSWKQPFPWDFLGWQEVTARAGDIGWRGHKRLWGGLSHLDTSSRIQPFVQSPSLNPHPCYLHINSSFRGIHLSFQLWTKLKEKHCQFTSTAFHLDSIHLVLSTNLEVIHLLIQQIWIKSQLYARCKLYHYCHFINEEIESQKG